METIRLYRVVKRPVEQQVIMDPDDTHITLGDIIATLVQTTQRLIHEHDQLRQDLIANDVSGLNTLANQLREELALVDERVESKTEDLLRFYRDKLMTLYGDCMAIQKHQDSNTKDILSLRQQVENAGTFNRELLATYSRPIAGTASSGVPTVESAQAQSEATQPMIIMDDLPPAQRAIQEASQKRKGKHKKAKRLSKRSSKKALFDAISLDRKRLQELSGSATRTQTVIDNQSKSIKFLLDRQNLMQKQLDTLLGNRL